MLALAAAGSQAEALAVYDTVRARLADDLGLDPGAELREAHGRVLRQQALAPPGATARRFARPSSPLTWPPSLDAGPRPPTCRGC